MRLAAAVLLCFLAAAPRNALAQADMEAILRAAAASGAPEDLRIRYRDLSTFHGGMVIDIQGDRSFRRWETGGMRDGMIATQNAGVVDAASLEALLALIVEFQAWRQETADRKAVPDESRASLILTTANARSFVWEWYNDLARNDRLVRIRDRMQGLAPIGRRSCVLENGTGASGVPPCNLPD